MPDPEDDTVDGVDETSETKGGNLPCDGCAGDICEQNSDCLGGFLCSRVDGDTAWCTNCNALGTACNSFCSDDVNCGVDGICHSERCWHACSSVADCPDGHDCFDVNGVMFCAPSDLPQLDEECIMSAAGWCESFVEGNGACIYTGTDPQTDPGENWCSKRCNADADCTDMWPLGCCSDPSVFESGDQYCLRPSFADLCDPPPQCTPDCDWCHIGTPNENNCNPMWDGDGECDCGCQFVDSDC